MSSTQSQTNSYACNDVECFSEWQNFAAAHTEDGQRRDAILDERPTMEMDNWTELRPLTEDLLYSRGETIKGDSLYERLDAHNRDNWWRWRVDVEISESVDFEFKKGVLAAIGYEIGLADVVLHEAFQRLWALDLRRAGVRLEVIAFCICAQKANEEATDRGRDKLYDPQRKAERNDDRIQGLAETLIDGLPGIDYSRLQSVWTKLTQNHLPKKDNPETTRADKAFRPQPTK